MEIFIDHGCSIATVIFSILLLFCSACGVISCFSVFYGLKTVSGCSQFSFYVSSFGADDGWQARNRNPLSLCFMFGEVVFYVTSSNGIWRVPSREPERTCQVDVSITSDETTTFHGIAVFHPLFMSYHRADFVEGYFGLCTVFLFIFCKRSKRLIGLSIL